MPSAPAHPPSLGSATPTGLRPLSPDEAYALAHRHFSAGQVALATNLLDTLLRHCPAHLPSLGMRAALHLRQGQPQAAEALIRQAQAQGIAEGNTHGSATLWCNLGTALADQQRPAEAEAAYQQACASDPAFALPWFNLGNLLHEQERLTEAAAAHREALARGPEARFWNNLGNVLTALGDYAEAGECFAAAIALSAAAGNRAAEQTALASRGNLHASQGDYAAAARDLRQAAEAMTAPEEIASARFNLSLVLFRQGRYAEAFPLYENRWTGCPGLRQQYRYPAARQWRGEPLRGQRLLLWCEQGLGDSLQFVRFVRAVQQRQPAQLALLVPPAVERLFAASFPELPLLPRSAAPAAEDFSRDWDYHCPLLSLWPALAAPALPEITQLPAALPGLSAAPYLSWPPSASCTPGQTLPPSAAGELRLGLCWRSGPGAEQRQRSLSLELLARGLSALRQQSPLWQQGSLRLRFISLLQPRADRPAEAAPLDWQLAGDWLDIMPACTDLADTAALMQGLDAVVTVDTALLHLAGALGLPVYGLFPAHGGNFFPQGRSDSPWYPTLRVIRQPAPDDWAGSLERLCALLYTELIVPRISAPRAPAAVAAAPTWHEAPKV